MYPIWSATLVAVISGVYFGWRVYHNSRQGRERVLRDRVTFMLWMMTQDREDEQEETMTSAGVS